MAAMRLIAFAFSIAAAAAVLFSPTASAAPCTTTPSGAITCGGGSFSANYTPHPATATTPQYVSYGANLGPVGVEASPAQSTLKVGPVTLKSSDGVNPPSVDLG